MGEEDGRPWRFRFATRMSEEPGRQEMGRVVAWPGSPTHHAAQLKRIEQLLAIEAEVEVLLKKVDTSKLRGNTYMKLGAFDKLREVARGQ